MAFVSVSGRVDPKNAVLCSTFVHFVDIKLYIMLGHEEKSGSIFYKNALNWALRNEATAADRPIRQII